MVKMCDASTQTESGYWIPDSFFDFPPGVSVPPNDYDSILEDVAALYEPPTPIEPTETAIAEEPSQGRTAPAPPVAEITRRQRRSPVTDAPDPLTYLLTVDWAEETERELAARERQEEDHRLRERLEREEERRKARERLMRRMEEPETLPTIANNQPALHAKETPMEEARRRRNLEALGKVIELGSEDAMRELDDYLEEAEPPQAVKKPTHAVQPVAQQPKPAPHPLRILPVESASWGPGPLEWDIEEERREPIPATVGTRGTTLSSAEPTQRASTPPPRPASPVRLRPREGARARRYNPNRQLTIDDLETPTDPSRRFRRPSVSPPPPPPVDRDLARVERERATARRSRSRSRTGGARSQAERPRATSTRRSEEGAAPQPTPPHRGEPHSRGDPITTGVMFGHLDRIPSNHDVDPPRYACYNCWEHGHDRARCPQRVTHRFCVNCGRYGVKIEDCPRCGRLRRRYISGLERGLSHEEAQAEALRSPVRERPRTPSVPRETPVAPSAEVFETLRPAYRGTLGASGNSAPPAAPGPLPPLRRPRPLMEAPAAEPTSQPERPAERSSAADRALVERIIDLAQRIPPRTIDAVLTHLFPQRPEGEPRREE